MAKNPNFVEDRYFITNRDADISKDEIHRYKLTRNIRMTSTNSHYNRILFIMLNPSTADHMKEDPTLRKCIAFAGHYSCTNLTVVNLFSLRSSSPKDLANKEIVTQANLDVLNEEIERHKDSNSDSWSKSLIIAAWGSNKYANQFPIEFLMGKADIYCLGKTKSGAPVHPMSFMYAGKRIQDAELEPFIMKSKLWNNPKTMLG